MSCLSVRVGSTKGWTQKKWCFQILVLEEILISQTVKLWNQSVLKEINFALEGLMLKLKIQYFGYLMWRVDLLKKSLILGKIESRRRRGKQKMRELNSITDSIYINLRKLRASLVAQIVKKLPAMQYTWVQSLGQEDHREKGIATHCSILICIIPWTEYPGRVTNSRT